MKKMSFRKKFQVPFKRRDVGTKLLPELLASIDPSYESVSDAVEQEMPILQFQAKKPRVEISHAVSQEVDFTDEEEDTISRSTRTIHRNSPRIDIPQTPKSTLKPTQENSSQNLANKNAPSYYTVIWGKQTTKKHKTWEGDGTLIIDGKNLTLKSGNKHIASASGVKLPDIIEQGTQIKIGGKEVEIQEKIDEFPLKETVNIPIPILPLKALPTKMISKPFIFPGNPTSNSEKPNTMKGKPLFNPTAPGALVMADPERNHQLIHNRENLDIVPVVVDPHISRHLRVHQREGVEFLYKCMQSTEFVSGCGAILADEMGLGKTLQTIAVLWTLMRQSPYSGKKEVRRSLIVTPSSLVKNWEREFHHWLGAERIRVFGVDSNHPLSKCPPQYPVIIISYDMLTRTEQLIKRMKFDIMVCDEAHKLKNRNGQANQLLSSLDCRRRILLTGTPIQNDLSELFALVNMAIPGILGSDWDFTKEYEKPIGRIQDSNSTPLEKQVGELKALELNGILAKFVLRRGHNVMIKYLPPRVTHILFCEPTKLQRELYKKLLEISTATTAALSVIIALKKLCNHPNLLHVKNNQEGSEIYKEMTGFAPQHSSDTYLINHSGKLTVLVGLLHSFRKENLKVVLVSHYTQTLDLFVNVCDSLNFPYKRLDGSTASNIRQNIVDSFNNIIGDSFVFLLSSKAGGVGLNLFGASRIILYDIDWNPSHDIQAMARCWRPGQKKITHIYRLITTGTIEERIYQRQIKKQDLSGSVMDLIVDNPAVISPHEYKDIFSLYTGDSCQTHDLLECECDQDGSNRINLLNEVKSTKKNQPMGELQKWEHFGPPFEGTNLDPAITSAGDQISFVFRSKFEDAKHDEKLE